MNGLQGEGGEGGRERELLPAAAKRAAAPFINSPHSSIAVPRLKEVYRLCFFSDCSHRKRAGKQLGARPLGAARV